MAARGKKLRPKNYFGHRVGFKNGATHRRPRRRVRRSPWQQWQNQSAQRKQTARPDAEIRRTRLRLRRQFHRRLRCLARLAPSRGCECQSRCARRSRTLHYAWPDVLRWLFAVHHRQERRHRTLLAQRLSRCRFRRTAAGRSISEIQSRWFRVDLSGVAVARGSRQERSGRFSRRICRRVGLLARVTLLVALHARRGFPHSRLDCTVGLCRFVFRRMDVAGF